METVSGAKRAITGLISNETGGVVCLDDNDSVDFSTVWWDGARETKKTQQPIQGRW